MAGPEEIFRQELKHRREEAGLTQQALGSLTHVSGAFICQIESGVRRAQPPLARAFDLVLKTDGLFERMAITIAKHADVPDYAKQAAVLLGEATSICEYAGVVLPGLLQTEGYATALMQAAAPNQSPEDTATNVRARLDRSANILESEKVPLLWMIIHELVLTAPIGSSAVMSEQLAHAVDVAHGRRAVIQVLQVKEGVHALTSTGQLALFGFAEDPPAAYLESAYSGQLVEDQGLVRKYQASFEWARAIALPPRTSLEFITSVAEDHRKNAKTDSLA
ncbi:helix-turn-helix transcriptional regulator [Streptomyces sp. NPDC003077]|uniref:helix-turn-helix domain-containing protein n=1 Tax=Streptomyces sp. NPDC003077 TaxID=3154443 RepID=UPI0033B24930